MNFTFLMALNYFVSFHFRSAFCEVNTIQVGVKHSISKYFPLDPEPEATVFNCSLAVCEE